MILAMECVTVLEALVWAPHKMTVSPKADTRASFSAVSVPTATLNFQFDKYFYGVIHLI